MTDYTTTMDVPAVTSIRYDDALGVLCVATDAAEFWAWNPIEGVAVSTPIANAYMWNLDVTADGQYALIADGNGVGGNQVERVAVATNALTPFSGLVSNSPNNNYIWAVATTQSGLALGAFNYLGTIQAFDPQGSVLNTTKTVLTLPPPDNSVPYGLVFYADMVSSENHRYVLIQAEQNLNPIDTGNGLFQPVATQPAALYLYDSTAGQVVAVNSSAFADSFNPKRPSQASGDDVSEAARMVAVATGGAIDIFDLSLTPVATLSSSGRNFLAAHFAAGGRQLFAWDSQSNDVVVFDTESWRQVGVIHAGSAADGQVAASEFSNFGQMAVSADGRMLFLQDYVAGTYGVVDAFDLAARLSLTVTGDAAHSTLYGGPGADTITGGGENDLIDGGGGNDLLDGGGGVNTVSYATATSGVTVSLGLQGQAQDTLGAGVDTLSNFQNLIGSPFADHLTGDGGDNVIDGGGGDDVLTGGGGADTFVYRPGNVTVTDFSDAQGDRIDLSAVIQFYSLGSVLAVATQSGANTLISIGGGSLTVDGVDKSSLQARDFIFGKSQLLTTIANDFDGGPTSEVAFRQASTGNWGYMTANASGGETWHAVGQSSPGYAVIAKGDFSGDGRGEIAFRSTVTGDWGYMSVNSSGGETWHAVGPTSLAYDALGAGDFNGDGSLDIAFRNATTGDWGFMTPNASGGESSYEVGPTSTAYVAVGVGDFDRDGRDDIAFRNPTTGDFGFMSVSVSGTEVWHPIGPTSPDYAAVGVGDFNGDGLLDVAFRQASTGNWGFMTINPGGGETWHAVGPTSTDYAVIGAADYNGDGRTDLAFRQASTGNWGFMSVNGSGQEVWRPVGPASTDYAAV